LPNPRDALDIESKILLNKTVENIQWNLEKPLITCNDGSTYSADLVIFTASLGVLKARHESLFTPQLPNRNQNAIRNLAMGSLEKMFLEFSEPFWQQNSVEWVQYSILWTQEDILAVTGTDREW
jgi:monoamine oxidase